MQMDENMYTILYRFIKIMTHECILTCVYVMKTVNRNPHSNEMRLTDRYNVHVCPCNNVGDILHKKASVSVRNVHDSVLRFTVSFLLINSRSSLDLLYLAITSIKICSSIVNFFQNFVQYWYTSIVIQLWIYEIAWIFYSVLDCFILEGSCYQLLKSILKVQVHCVSFNWHI